MAGAEGRKGKDQRHWILMNCLTRRMPGPPTFSTVGGCPLPISNSQLRSVQITRTSMLVMLLVMLLRLLRSNDNKLLNNTIINYGRCFFTIINYGVVFLFFQDEGGVVSLWHWRKFAR
jgi:hypothetical protein